MKEVGLIALILSVGLLLPTVLTSIAFGSSASVLEVKTEDELVMTLSEDGQVEGLSADGSELLCGGCDQGKIRSVRKEGHKERCTLVLTA